MALQMEDQVHKIFVSESDYQDVVDAHSKANQGKPPKSPPSCSDEDFLHEESMHEENSHEEDDVTPRALFQEKEINDCTNNHFENTKTIPPKTSLPKSPINDEPIQSLPLLKTLSPTSPRPINDLTSKSSHVHASPLTKIKNPTWQVPTTPSHPSSSNALKSSPTRSQTPVNQKALSPIPISNTFGPLQRPKPSISSKTSSSGPIFPPGFETFISPRSKAAHMREKWEKKKKKSKKASALMRNPPLPEEHRPETSTPPPPPSICPNVSNVMKIANLLELKFNGPPSVLRQRIENILSRQKQEWDCIEL